MTQLTDNLYAVETDKDVIGFKFNSKGDAIYPMLHGSATLHPIQLPSGNWQIIGTVTKDSIDFDCRKFIEGYGIDRWRNYKFESQYEEVLKSTPEYSFRSLLTSKGLTDYNKLVIIKSK